MVDFEMPLEVESLEQGVASIAYGIGEKFRPRRPPPWLADGWTWQDRLPWMLRMEEYKARPMCSVEKDWFKLAAKKLRPLADPASESDLCLAFVQRRNPENCWLCALCHKATQLDHLPKRLANPVVIGVWEGRLTIGRKVWNLAKSELLLEAISTLRGHLFQVCRAGGTPLSLGRQPEPVLPLRRSGAPCQLPLLAGPEHGRTIPLADISGRLTREVNTERSIRLLYEATP